MREELPAYAGPMGLAAAAAQVAFIVSWLMIGAAEKHGYRPIRDDISDLGALTAHHATVFRVTLFVVGAITIAFGLLVVGPALRSVWAGGLVAMSLLAFDPLTDALFRLDCRAADAGCSAADALSSWHARMHLACFVLSAVATLVAPFVIARGMRREGASGDAVARVRRFGYVVVALLAVAVVTSGTPVQGLTQRVATTVIPLGFAVFAIAIVRRERGIRRVATLLGGR